MNKSSSEGHCSTPSLLSCSTCLVGPWRSRHCGTIFPGVFLQAFPHSALISRTLEPSCFIISLVRANTVCFRPNSPVSSSIFAVRALYTHTQYITFYLETRRNMRSPERFLSILSTGPPSLWDPDAVIRLLHFFAYRPFWLVCMLRGPSYDFLGFVVVPVFCNSDYIECHSTGS